jgi:hypothetical protein
LTGCLQGRKQRLQQQSNQQENGHLLMATSRGGLLQWATNTEPPINTGQPGCEWLRIYFTGTADPAIEGDCSTKKALHKRYQQDMAWAC